MYFCSKEQTSKQDKAKHSKQNGFQIVTRTPAYCAEHPSTKGCRFSIQSYIKSLKAIRLPPKKTACPTLLMLRTKQIVNSLNGVERFDRHFDKHRIPVAHGAVP